MLQYIMHSVLRTIVKKIIQMREDLLERVIEHIGRDKRSLKFKHHVEKEHELTLFEDLAS